MSRRMSYRQSAAARRHIKALEHELDQLRGGHGTWIAEGTVCENATIAIRTARRLGFTIVIAELDGKMIARAVKRGDR